MAKSLVEERAEREGLRTVRLTRHDLLSVLTGDPMMCSDDAGAEVAVRMFRPEELLLAAHESRAALAERMGWSEEDMPPPMTRAQAERLTETVPASLIWGVTHG